MLVFTLKVLVILLCDIGFYLCQWKINKMLEVSNQNQSKYNCLGVSPTLCLAISGSGREGDLTGLGEKDEESLKSSLPSEVLLNPLPHPEYR